MFAKSEPVLMHRTSVGSMQSIEKAVNEKVKIKEALRSLR